VSIYLEDYANPSWLGTSSHGTGQGGHTCHHRREGRLAVEPPWPLVNRVLEPMDLDLKPTSFTFWQAKLYLQDGDGDVVPAVCPPVRLWCDMPKGAQLWPRREIDS
jgi:hypothetical protein